MSLIYGSYHPADCRDEVLSLLELYRNFPITGPE
jgi:hypothetical protein